MTTAVIYALLSAVFAALVTLFAKIGLSEVDPIAATTIRTCVMAIFLVGVAIATGKVSSFPSTTGVARWWIVASGIAGATSWLFYFVALRVGSASVVAALDRTSIVFIVLGSAAWLGEQLTIRAAFGAVLVVAGVILMAFKPQ